MLGSILALILLIAVILLLTFLPVAGFTAFIFWCFGWQWSWGIAFGIWLLAIFLRLLFAPAK